MRRWNNLPEWLRWILCWPVILVAAILAYHIFPWFIAFGARYEIVYYDVISIPLGVGASIVATGYSAKRLMPRRPDIFMGFLAVANLIFSITVIPTIYLHWDFYIDNGMKEFITDTLSCFAGLSVSWWFFLDLRKEHKQKETIK